MGHDGANVRFVPVGAHTPAPEVFLARAMNGRASQQPVQAFPLAPIWARRNDVMGPVDFS
ncbi:hypothetical protein [Kocuria atrinae]|uniref:hypothetical protein n=1 Tax=Kocuria atrinae TaxID=592377 RepID=UPI0002E75821|nr:hypothetical protein [Kocuria atrinae]